MLSAVESSGTHSLRLTLTRQLAEVLLRGYTGMKYTPPTNGIPILLYLFSMLHF